MKKRYFIPSLLLLASTSLTACSGEGGGLVKNGQRYREGDATYVDPALRAQKEGTITSVTENMSMTLSMKVSYRGQSASVSEKMSGTAKIDLVNKTMRGDFKATASVSGAGSQTTKVTFYATEVNGFMTIVSGENYEDVYTMDELGVMFDEASYSIYSWNYAPSESQLNKLSEELDSLSNVVSANDVISEFNKLYANLYIAGNVDTGNFEVGLAEGYTMNLIDGMPITFNKMKSTYKNCLLQESVAGITMKGKEDEYTYNVTESITVKYSYNTSSNGSQPGPTNPFGL